MGPARTERGEGVGTMQGGAVVQHVTTRRLLFVVIACGALAGACPFVGARGGPPPAGPPRGPDPELLHASRTVPGDAKPIVLHADAITTWAEGNRRVLYLEGQVLVEQGVLQARFQQGVVWVDLEKW